MPNRMLIVVPTMRWRGGRRRRRSQHGGPWIRNRPSWPNRNSSPTSRRSTATSILSSPKLSRCRVPNCFLCVHKFRREGRTSQRLCICHRKAFNPVREHVSDHCSLSELLLFRGREGGLTMQYVFLWSQVANIQDLMSHDVNCKKDEQEKEQEYFKVNLQHGVCLLMANVRESCVPLQNETDINVTDKRPDGA